MATFNPRAILAGDEPGAWSAPTPIAYDQRDVLLYAVGIPLVGFVLIRRHIHNLLYTIALPCALHRPRPLVALHAFAADDEGAADDRGKADVGLAAPARGSARWWRHRLFGTEEVPCTCPDAEKP